MTPDKQSAKARLHSRMLLGLCKEGVLVTAIMATRLQRKAKTQSGTFTAVRATSFMKTAVSLIGITSCASRPQMLLFITAVILIHYCTRDTSQFFFFFYLKREEISWLMQNLRTDSVSIQSLLPIFKVLRSIFWANGPLHCFSTTLQSFLYCKVRKRKTTTKSKFIPHPWGM